MHLSRHEVDIEGVSAGMPEEHVGKHVSLDEGVGSDGNGGFTGPLRRYYPTWS